MNVDLHKPELYVEDFLQNTHNRPKKKIKKMKGEALHGTANFGVNANAKANRDFFQKTEAYASSQEITDENGILRTMEWDEVGYHAGAKNYTELGYEIMEGGYTPNYFLAGNELCVHSNGNFTKTMEYALINSVNRMKMYSYDETHIWRHFDITGKACPSFLLNDSELTEYRQRARWLYKAVFGSGAIPNDYPIIPEDMVVVTDGLNVRGGPGIEFPVVKKFNKGVFITAFELVNDYFHIGGDLWVHCKYVDETTYSPFDEYIKLDENDADAYIITSDWCLVYAEPSAGSIAVKEIHKGDKFKAKAVAQCWIESEYGFIHNTDCKALNPRKVVDLTDKDVYDEPNPNGSRTKIVKQSTGIILNSLDMNDIRWMMIKEIDGSGELQYIREE